MMIFIMNQPWETGSGDAHDLVYTFRFFTEGTRRCGESTGHFRPLGFQPNGLYDFAFIQYSRTL